MIFKSFVNFCALLIAVFGFTTPAFSEIMVQSGWMRAKIPSRPAAGYFELINHGPADTMLSAASPAFKTVEIHTHTMTDGIMRMRKLDRLATPAHETIVFQPHGLHLMMFDPVKQLKNGDTVEVTLVFETAGEITLSLTVGDKKQAHSMHRNGNHNKNHHDHSGH